MAPDPARALDALLKLEAHRARAAEAAPADPARVAEGWERRCVVDAARAAELMELYSELGFEVAADPVSGAEVGGEDCAECRLVAMLRFRAVYTRRPRSP